MKEPMTLGLDSLKNNLKSFNLADHKLVKTELVEGDKYQPRDGIDTAWVTELMESLKKHGQLTPITVVFEDNVYRPIDGHHRLEAAKKLGWDEVAVLVQPNTIAPNQRREHALVTNVKRKGINPWEIGKTLEALKKENDYTLEELGSVIGKGKSTVKDYLRVPQLPDQFYEDFMASKGKISPAIVIEVAREADTGKQADLWTAVQSGYVTSRNDIRALKKQGKKKVVAKKISTKKDRLLRDLAGLAVKAQSVIDEGVDLDLAEYEKAETSIKAIQKYLKAQKEKLHK